MKKLKIFIIFFLYLILSPPILMNAQRSILSAGGSSSNTGGSISFSVGLLGFTSSSNANGSLIQGVQIPYEIVVTAIEEKNSLSANIMITPNPVADNLKLTIEIQTNKTFYYELYDLNGKILLKEKIRSNETLIPLTEFKAGQYFLKIIDNSNNIKIFKIIKNY